MLSVYRGYKYSLIESRIYVSASTLKKYQELRNEAAGSRDVGPRETETKNIHEENITIKITLKLYYYL